MRHRYITLILLLLTGLLFSSVSVQAQDNLLTNPGFENAGQYVDQRPAGSDYAFAMAPGWQGWFTKQPSTAEWMNDDPIAYPHTGNLKHQGNTSQNIGRGFATFTAASYQVVNNIPEGTTLRFRAWVFQENDEGNGARTRIGIGSNIGGNVLGNVQWSPWLDAIRSWQQLEVSATVPEGSVTVIIYSTQAQPNNPNQVYYDQASLVATGSGDPNIGGGDDGGEDGEEVNVPAPPTSTPFDVAPFVDPQAGDDEGRIVHNVQSGDTLAAIAVAYGVSVDEIRQRNNLSGNILQVGQQLLIQEASPQSAATEPPADDSETGEDTDEDTSSEVVTDDETGSEDEPTTVAQANSPTPAPTETPEATEEVTDEPTEEVTDEPTEEVTDEPTPDITSTPSPIPPTPTDAPPAPVEEGAEADPLDTEAEICMLMFDDSNQNRIRETGEPLLANGIITLEPSLGGEPMQYTTDGASEPYCFESLEPGSYTASAVAPEGYGITTSNNLVVSAPPGQRFQIRFGAAQGVEVAAVPTADADTDTIDQTQPVATEPDVSGIRNILGLLVIGLAAVVLVGGVAVALIIRGR